MSGLTDAEVRELTKTTAAGFYRLRASHDRLLAAATLVVDAAEDPDSASGDVALSIENLHAAITAAEEQA